MENLFVPAKHTLNSGKVSASGSLWVCTRHLPVHFVQNIMSSSASKFVFEKFFADWLFEYDIVVAVVQVVELVGLDTFSLLMQAKALHGP